MRTLGSFPKAQLIMAKCWDRCPHMATLAFEHYPAGISPGVDRTLYFNNLVSGFALSPLLSDSPPDWSALGGGGLLMRWRQKRKAKKPQALAV